MFWMYWVKEKYDYNQLLLFLFTFLAMVPGQFTMAQVVQITFLLLESAWWESKGKQSCSEPQLKKKIVLTFKQ